jgi:hypothetical protein
MQMLTSDLLMEIRASRRISSEQIARLERMVFGSGTPSRDQLELLLLLDTYLQRRDAGWAELLARAAAAAVPLSLPRAA